MISHIRDDKFNFVCKILYNLIESLISNRNRNFKRNSNLFYYFISQYIIHIIKYTCILLNFALIFNLWYIIIFLKNKYKFNLIKRNSILVIILINYKQDNQLKIIYNLNNNK